MSRLLFSLLPGFVLVAAFNPPANVVQRLHEVQSVVNEYLLTESSSSLKRFNEMFQVNPFVKEKEYLVSTQFIQKAYLKNGTELPSLEQNFYDTLNAGTLNESQLATFVPRLFKNMTELPATNVASQKLKYDMVPYHQMDVYGVDTEWILFNVFNSIICQVQITFFKTTLELEQVTVTCPRFV